MIAECPNFPRGQLETRRFQPLRLRGPFRDSEIRRNAKVAHARIAISFAGVTTRGARHGRGRLLDYTVKLGNCNCQFQLLRRGLCRGTFQDVEAIASSPPEDSRILPHFREERPQRALESFVLRKERVTINILTARAIHVILFYRCQINFFVTVKDERRSLKSNVVAPGDLPRLRNYSKDGKTRFFFVAEGNGVRKSTLPPWKSPRAL